MGNTDYVGQSYNVYSCGKNLLSPRGYLPTRTINGITFEVFDSGVIHAYGVASSPAKFMFDVSDIRRNETYTFSINPNITDVVKIISIVSIPGRGNMENNPSQKPITITATSNMTSIGFGLYFVPLQEAYDVWIYPMLERGTTRTEWVSNREYATLVNSNEILVPTFEGETNIFCTPSTIQLDVTYGITQECNSFISSIPSPSPYRNSYDIYGGYSSPGWYRIGYYNAIGQIANGHAGNYYKIIINSDYQKDAPQCSVTDIYCSWNEFEYKNNRIGSNLFDRIRQVYNPSTLTAYLEIHYTRTRLNNARITVESTGILPGFFKPLSSPISTSDSSTDWNVTWEFDISKSK